MSDIEDWFEKDFWPYYRSLKDLHDGNPGVKKTTLTACKKRLIGVSLERVLRKTKELAIFDIARKKKGEFVPRWPYGSTFINQEYYDREIPEQVKKVVKKQTLCDQPGCMMPAAPPHKQCIDCWGKISFKQSEGEASGRNELLRKNGESNQEYITRLRRFCEGHVGKG